MSLILNIETATAVCSVALARNGIPLAIRENNEGRMHASLITVFIEEVMKESGFLYKQLDAVAVSKGPGSYTGLRIGVSTAKGLCYALDKPLIGVNTLQSMAFGAANQYPDSDWLFCPMIDARRMEVYTCFFNKKYEALKSISADIVDENSYVDILSSDQVLFLGDGAAKCKAVLGEHKNATFDDTIFPSSKWMAPLAQKSFDEGNFEDTAYFEPFYLKDFVVTKKR